VGLPNAERQRRYINKLKAQAKAAAPGASDDARIRELEAELARERTRIEILQDGLLQVARRQQAASKPPKAANRPLPPDEVRDRQIKALRTEVRSLKGKLRAMEKHYNEAIAKAGGMNAATENAVAKALQPHTRKQMTEAQLDAACKGFLAWKSDKAKANHR
jgi:hypothetical protein